MGSVMTCKQQYCCGDRRNCTGPYEPPTRTTDEYEADKEAGRQPVGKPTDRKG